MPHFVIEYSSNVENLVDLKLFCEEIRRTAIAVGMFETGAVRVRATRCEHYAIADGDPRNSFIDVSLRMGAGRELAAKKKAGDAIFSAMSAFLRRLLDSKYFALSFEIREIDPELSYRKNSIHERLRTSMRSGQRREQ